MSGVLSALSGSLYVAAGSSYLLTDGLEYVDASAASAGGWVDASSPTWGYATSPAPLQGSYSLMVDGSADDTYHTFASGNAEIWAFCMCQFDALTNSPYVIRLRNSSGTEVAAVRFMSTGAVRAYNGTGNTSSGAGVVAAATTYYVWVRYVTGTGADSITTVYISTTTTIPGSPTVSRTTGNATTNAERVAFQMSVAGSVGVFDYLRVNNSSIGSAPS